MVVSGKGCLAEQSVDSIQTETSSKTFVYPKKLIDGVLTTLCTPRAFDGRYVTVFELALQVKQHVSSWEEAVTFLDGFLKHAQRAFSTACCRKENRKHIL